MGSRRVKQTKRLADAIKLPNSKKFTPHGLQKTLFLQTAHPRHKTVNTPSPKIPKTKSRPIITPRKNQHHHKQ